MKKIKIFAASLLFVAVAVTGYKAWQNSHLTPEEALMKANIEALASDETGEHGGGLANTHCPIWNVTIEYRWGNTPVVVACSTGGEYKCAEGLCPHGSY